jgi:hypothetical protein
MRCDVFLRKRSRGPPLKVGAWSRLRPSTPGVGPALLEDMGVGGLSDEAPTGI